MLHTHWDNNITLLKKQIACGKSEKPYYNPYVKNTSILSCHSNNHGARDSFWIKFLLYIVLGNIEISLTFFLMVEITKAV